MTALHRRLTGPGSPGRAVAARAVDHVLVPLGGGPPPGLRRGLDRPADGDSAVLLVLRDEDPAATSRLIDVLGSPGAVPDGVVPVLLLPAAGWPLARQAGYVVEQLPADTEAGPRLAELRRTYVPDAVVLLSRGWGTETADAAWLAAVSGHGRRAGTRARLRRWLRRLERRLDPGPA